MELINQIHEKKIKILTANKGIKSHFSQPCGLHFGGVHETMSKFTKKEIYGILGITDITDEELDTAFAGAVDLANSQRLTYQSSDIEDDVPLT